MTMREGWAAVYRDRITGHPIVGSWWPTRGGSVRADAGFPPRAVCRVHVKLKPEGAPKRYSDAAERWAWETYPHAMRAGVPADLMLMLS
jgi:hypothetical protein